MGLVQSLRDLFVAAQLPVSALKSFSLPHLVVFAEVMDHPVTWVRRHNVIVKMPLLACKSLPVSYLKVGPLGQLLQLLLELTIEACLLH